MSQKIFIFMVLVLNREYGANKGEVFDIAESTFNDMRSLFEDRYPIEEHKIITQDGYILTLYRIPPKYNNNSNLLYKKNEKSIIKSPVYLHHALALDSASWFWSISNDIALPLTLSDAGYDIWLGNSRGAFLSRNHTKLNYKTSRKYWDFTWHEIGIYDLPAVIDYILLKTNSQKLHYIGHSQGTAAFFVLTTELSKYNEKILSFHGLTPTVFMENIGSPYVEFLSEKFGDPNNDGSYYESSKKPPPISVYRASRYTAEFCKIFYNMRFCTLLYSHIFGSNGLHINEETAINIFKSSPQGTSMKSVLHFFQIIKTGRFQKYDYGEELNHRIYEKAQPPSYDLKKITCPVFLYYSEYDLFNSFAGNIRLSNALRPETLHLNYTVPAKYEFNHMDFIHGKIAKQLIFQRILKGLEDVVKKSEKS